MEETHMPMGTKISTLESLCRVARNTDAQLYFTSHKVTKNVPCKCIPNVTDLKTIPALSQNQIKVDILYFYLLNWKTLLEQEEGKVDALINLDLRPAVTAPGKGQWEASQWIPPRASPRRIGKARSTESASFVLL